MLKIWKYPFEIVDSFELEMPAGAKILSLQMQYDRPCIWALVEIENVNIRTGYGMEMRRFRTYGTGQPIDEQGEHVGTYQIRDNYNESLVFHVFDVTRSGNK